MIHGRSTRQQASSRPIPGAYQPRRTLDWLAGPSREDAWWEREKTKPPMPMWPTAPGGPGRRRRSPRGSAEGCRTTPRRLAPSHLRASGRRVNSRRRASTRTSVAADQHVDVPQWPGMLEHPRAESATRGCGWGTRARRVRGHDLEVGICRAMRMASIQNSDWHWHAALSFSDASSSVHRRMQHRERR